MKFSSTVNSSVSEQAGAEPLAEFAHRIATLLRGTSYNEVDVLREVKQCSTGFNAPPRVVRKVKEGTDAANQSLCRLIRKEFGKSWFKLEFKGDRLYRTYLAHQKAAKEARANRKQGGSHVSCTVTCYLV